ncbi:MAG: DUF2283 domain-containing protein [archaeon]|nr:DUF2283 domain-containing protein [archaeon]
MEKILKIFYSKEIDSLDVWIDEPEKKKMAREMDEGIIAKLNSEGNVIGLEITSLSTLSKKPLVIPIKAQGN